MDKLTSPLLRDLADMYAKYRFHEQAANAVLTFDSWLRAEAARREGEAKELGQTPLVGASVIPSNGEHKGLDSAATTPNIPPGVKPYTMADAERGADLLTHGLSAATMSARREGEAKAYKQCAECLSPMTCFNRQKCNATFLRIAASANSAATTPAADAPDELFDWLHAALKAATTGDHARSIAAAMDRIEADARKIAVYDVANNRREATIAHQRDLINAAQKRVAELEAALREALALIADDIGAMSIKEEWEAALKGADNG